MNNITSVQDKRNKIESRLNEFRYRQKKQIYLATAFWVVLAVVLAIIISPYLQIHNSPVRNLISIFIILVVLIGWINYIPFLGILTLITVRTKSKNYLKQLFPNLGMLIIITLVVLINSIEFGENLITVLYIGILLIIIVLESIFLRLVIKEAKENRKPLFIWTFFQDPFLIFKSTILTVQSLDIEEELDGYSQRPFFITFKEIQEYCHNENDFQVKISEYAKFLTDRSELIGWDRKLSSIRLYPRVLIANPNLVLGILFLWEIFLKIMRKSDLTCISINYKSKEMAISISKQDYDLLNDVTFHVLGISLLERFKESIIAYLENEKEKAYTSLFQVKTSI